MSLKSGKSELITREGVLFLIWDKAKGGPAHGTAAWSVEEEYNGEIERRGMGAVKGLSVLPAFV